MVPDQDDRTGLGNVLHPRDLDAPVALEQESEQRLRPIAEIAVEAVVVPRSLDDGFDPPRLGHREKSPALVLGNTQSLADGAQPSDGDGSRTNISRRPPHLLAYHLGEASKPLPGAQPISSEAQVGER